MIVQKMTSSVRLVAPSATALVDPGEMHEGSNGEEGQRNSPSDADSLLQVRPSLPRCTRHCLHHSLSLFPSHPCSPVSYICLSASSFRQSFFSSLPASLSTRASHVSSYSSSSPSTCYPVSVLPRCSPSLSRPSLCVFE